MGATSSHLGSIAALAANYPQSADPLQGRALLTLILDTLTAEGAEEIVDIPLAGKSSIADFMVVASGRSTRQVASLSEKLVEKLKADMGITARVEGKEAADWVLIDASDVIVHIFRPEVREFYQLEKMWMPALDMTARPA